MGKGMTLALFPFLKKDTSMTDSNLHTYKRHKNSTDVQKKSYNSIQKFICKNVNSNTCRLYANSN